MPKLTRNQLFLKAFDNFMVSMSDLYYPTMTDWKIVEKTENKGRSRHIYELNIPKKKVLGHIDTAYVDENGINQEPGELVGEQEIPNKSLFENYLNGYFGEFALQNVDLDMVSFVSCLNTKEIEDGLNTTVIVRYFKSHIPYPCDGGSISQIKTRCNELEEEIVRLNEYIEEFHNKEAGYKKRISHLKRKMLNERTNNRVKLYDIMHKMEGKIIEMYGKMIEKNGVESLEECPVCYEAIRQDAIAVPKCCHFICLECYNRCDSCPLCRSDYVL